MNKAAIAIFVAFFCLAIAGANGQTIVDIVAGNSQLSSLANVVTSAPYAAILAALNNTNANLTLFAPNNAAFTAATLPTNTTLVTFILQYHVLGSRVPSSALSALQFPPTILTATDVVTLNGQGQVVQVTSGTSVKVNTANVVTANLEATNGVVHIIDQVLTYPAATSAVASGVPTLSSLVSNLVAQNLVTAVDTTPKVTIFAPVNSAFSAGVPTNIALKDILTFHVVAGVVGYSSGLTNGTVLTTLQGQKLTVLVNGGTVQVVGGSVTATVTTANVLTKNGVVHVIDKVLIPTVSTTATGTGSGSAGFAASPSVLIAALGVIIAFFAL